jgi:predicted SAM-dependent methyltransferase
MKLNIGCGSKLLDGYVNIDIVSPAADLNADCCALPFKQGTIDRIESYHLIEHMDRHKAEKALRHWWGLLKVGGTLVLECPDLLEVCKNYIAGNEEMLYSIYGRNRYEYDTHLWGYSKQSLKNILLLNGYEVTKIMNGTDYHASMEPCFRIEAKKC